MSDRAHNGSKSAPPVTLRDGTESRSQFSETRHILLVSFSVGFRTLGLALGLCFKILHPWCFCVFGEFAECSALSCVALVQECMKMHCEHAGAMAHRLLKCKAILRTNMAQVMSLYRRRSREADS